MPTPLRNLSPAEPTWLPPATWTDLATSGTDAFLAAHATDLRIERWGDALRVLCPTPPAGPRPPPHAGNPLSQRPVVMARARVVLLALALVLLAAGSAEAVS